MTEVSGARSSACRQMGPSTWRLVRGSLSSWIQAPAGDRCSCYWNTLYRVLSVPEMETVWLVGLWPNTPQKAAGVLTLPPVSEPRLMMVPALACSAASPPAQLRRYSTVQYSTVQY